ncbi:MAG: ATP-binding cassette domain-containing protein [Ignavibacteria bacterium]|nr:ATP-binding cassette domain-containing protein [Ignavibacteria bacterium]
MITIDSISKSFGEGTPNEVRALDSVSLTITAHEFVIVIGTNGSGKSTLLNAIAGSVPLHEGRILIDDVDVSRLANHERARFIGRVFQNPFSGTAPTMTIAENLRLAALRGARKGLSVGLNNRSIRDLQERCSELGMGLEHRMETPIGLLSGGQRQALTLLMATLREPKILLLDEHTAALDPKSAEQVLQLTETLVMKHRLTTLMVTHDMQEAVRVGTRLVMMDRGAVIVDKSGADKQAITEEQLVSSFVSLGQHSVPEIRDQRRHISKDSPEST